MLAGYARSASAADYPASDAEKSNITLIADFRKAFDEPKIAEFYELGLPKA